MQISTLGVNWLLTPIFLLGANTNQSLCCFFLQLFSNWHSCQNQPIFQVDIARQDKSGRHRIAFCEKAADDSFHFFFFVQTNIEWMQRLHFQSCLFCQKHIFDCTVDKKEQFLKHIFSNNAQRIVGPPRHGTRHDPIDKRSDKLANLVNAQVYMSFLWIQHQLQRIEFTSWYHRQAPTCVDFLNQLLLLFIVKVHIPAKMLISQSLEMQGG